MAVNCTKTQRVTPPLLRRSGKRATSATTRIVRACLPLVGAAPCFFRGRPTKRPICKAGCAIKRLRSSCDRRGHSATLVMNTAAPLLFTDGPSILPVGEALCAIVWVSWRRGHAGGNIIATLVMHIAAPLPLQVRPRRNCTDGTIERICMVRRCSCRWRRCRRRQRCRCFNEGFGCSRGHRGQGLVIAASTLPLAAIVCLVHTPRNIVSVEVDAAIEGSLLRDPPAAQKCR